MSWGGAYYETTSVRVLPGLAERTVDRRQADGWELVARADRGRRTEIYFRRVVKPDEAGRTSRGLRHGRALAVAGAAAVALVGVVVVTGGDDSAPAAAAGTTDTAQVLTVADDESLAALVTVADACSTDVTDYARDHEGDTVELDATVAATAARPGSRYDVLLRAGDHDDSPATGPALALQGVTLADLHLAAGARDYVAKGDDVRITATVGTFDADGCLLHLAPLTTALR